jgi:hypothetical protein
MSTERVRTRWHRAAGAHLAAALLLAAGCSGTQRTGDHPLEPLPESRALEVINEGFQHVGVTPELHRRIHIQGGLEMEIDVATAGHPHGVEFVSGQDLVDIGQALPHRQHEGSLLTLVGTGPDANTDVLILDEREFMFEREADQAGPGRPTLLEVEDRLRRAVIDYLTYLRDHHSL